MDEDHFSFLQVCAMTVSGVKYLLRVAFSYNLWNLFNFLGSGDHQLIELVMYVHECCKIESVMERNIFFVLWIRIWGKIFISVKEMVIQYIIIFK